MKPLDADYFSCDACNPFLLHGSEQGILLIHGFSGSVAHMRPLGNVLHACGYTVMGINLPGHATTERDMAKASRADWENAVRDAATTLRSQCKSITACGLSMGALLSLLLAEQQRVDACVSISAPMPSANPWLPVSGLLRFAVPRISWNDDPERKQQLDPYYDKGYTGFPTRKAADLYSLILKVRRNLRQITCPTLVIQSVDDTSVKQSSADTIYNGISSTQKKKLLLEGVPHVCTISGKLPSIVDEIDTLLKSMK